MGSYLKSSIMLPLVAVDARAARALAEELDSDSIPGLVEWYSIGNVRLLKGNHASELAGGLHAQAGRLQADKRELVESHDAFASAGIFGGGAEALSVTPVTLTAEWLWGVVLVELVGNDLRFIFQPDPNVDAKEFAHYQKLARKNSLLWLDDLAASREA